MSRLTLKKLDKEIKETDQLVASLVSKTGEVEDLASKTGWQFVFSAITFIAAVAALVSCTPVNKAPCRKDDGSFCHERTVPEKEETTTVVAEPVSEYLSWMTIVDRDDSICENVPNGVRKGDLGFEEKFKVPNTFNHRTMSRNSNGTIASMLVEQRFSNSYLFSLEGKELDDWIKGKGKFEVREVNVDEYYVQGEVVEFGYHYSPGKQYATIQIPGKTHEGSRQFRVNFLTVLDDFTPITMCEYNGVYYLVLEENSIILIDKDNVRQQAVHTGQVWSN